MKMLLVTIMILGGTHLSVMADGTAIVTTFDKTNGEVLSLRNEDGSVSEYVEAEGYSDLEVDELPQKYHSAKFDDATVIPF